MGSTKAAVALGLDFGTTNAVAALADGAGHSRPIEFTGAEAAGPVFRSALCFWEDEQARNGVAHEAGPRAIAEYLQSPLDSRFVQSFKTVAASPLFERALIFNRPFRFEDLGRSLHKKPDSWPHPTTCQNFQRPLHSKGVHRWVFAATTSVGGRELSNPH